VKETAATLKTVRGAEGGDRGELVARSRARSWRTPASARTRSAASSRAAAHAGVEILDELGAVNRIVGEGSPEDAAALREWLLDAAPGGGERAKEGGFIGFHAERVSEGEQRMLDSLRDTLSEG
jgi:hypothetical protein